MVQMNLFAKQKERHRCKNKLMDTKGGRRGGMNWEIEIDVYALLCIK